MKGGFTFRLDGDVESQRKLQENGANVRFAVGKAIAKLTREGLQIARSGAPTARTRAGVNAYGYGFEANGIPRGRGIPRWLTRSVTRVAEVNRSGGVSSIITNEYYLGRFRETGFDGTVEVKAHTRRAKGRKNWTRPKHIQTAYRSFAKSGVTNLGEMAAKAKSQGWNDRKLRLLTRGGQVAVDFYKRRHKVRQARFFSLAEEAIAPKFESAIREAMKEGLA